MDKLKVKVMKFDEYTDLRDKLFKVASDEQLRILRKQIEKELAKRLRKAEIKYFMKNPAGTHETRVLGWEWKE